MRPLYLILWLLLPYILRIFYRRIKVLNTQKEFYAQTILVCNHPSAFIDPLIIANFQNPIIHFMTRSDVFKPWLKPVTWACHMVPIYRMAEDGNDSPEKNIATFREAIKILQKKKSLIMFGEGYTDDVFIRSLKPLKKGPARIAFGAMAATDWKEDIKVQAIGVNYSDPKAFNCDLLLSGGKVIHLKDYKKLYDESPAKAATTLMRDIDRELKAQITYVKDKTLFDFVEHIQAIKRNGMHHLYRENSIPLAERYHNSKQIATFVNENYQADSEQWNDLKNSLNNYFKEEKKNHINENWVYQFEQGKSKNLATRFIKLILLFPFFLIGFVHLFMPYILVKKLVEKMFRRKVFWSGVKLLLGALVGTLFTLPAIWLFHDYIYPSYWLGVAYYLVVPITCGVIAYNYGLLFADTIRILKTSSEKLKLFSQKRRELVLKIKEIGL